MVVAAGGSNSNRQEEKHEKKEADSNNRDHDQMNRTKSVGRTAAVVVVMAAWKGAIFGEIRCPLTRLSDGGNYKHPEKGRTTKKNTR